MKRVGCKGSERGFTLVELMTSMSITLIIVLSLYGMVDLNQRLSRDEHDIAEMQQNGRAAMEFLVRDLHSAGYDLVRNGTLDTFGVVFPNSDCSDDHVTNAITLWSNPGLAMGTVERDMPQPSSELVLDALGDFVVGDQAIIVGLGNDGLMHNDFFIVTAIQDNEGQGELHLQHRPPINPEDFTTCYQAGASVLILDSITYYIQDDGTGVNELYREFRRPPESPVARNVKEFSLRYFGDGNPPPELTNITSAVERLKIRKIEITLTVETERPGIGSGEKREITWKTQVSPRNLVYRKNI